MRKYRIVAALAFLGAAGMARADLTIIGGSTTSPNCTTAETGQGLPTGVCGFVDGSINDIKQPNGEDLMFTYLGHGDSTQADKWTVDGAGGTSGFFCTQVDALLGCAVKSNVGDTFTLPVTDGPVDYIFSVDRNGTILQMQHDTSDATLGAALVQIGLGATPNAGPGNAAYIGYSDLPFPTDRDFQDFTARISEVPEPATLPFLGASLLGLALYARRRRNLAK